jgi:hypothetical protein
VVDIVLLTGGWWMLLTSSGQWGVDLFVMVVFCFRFNF